MCVGNCSDPSHSVDVSFIACVEQEGSNTTSVYTYTNVMCTCPSGTGDISVRVELPNGLIANYRGLSTTPDSDLLNATRCDNSIQDSKPYSFCIKFADLTMVEDITRTKLVSEVTDALLFMSSTACLVINFSGMFVYLTV